MGRPTIKAQRREQILDAFEVCVGKFGVEGATLEKIAEQAGLARALIRHHVGNRDELLDEFVERFLSKTRESSRLMFDSLLGDDRVQQLIDCLFDEAYTDRQTVVVISALIIAANDRPALAQALNQWVASFTQSVADELTAAYPRADESIVSAVAAGITGIYFNVDSFTPIGEVPGLRQASRRAVDMLVEGLANA